MIMKSRLDEYKTQLYLYLCSKFINYPFFIFLWYRLNKIKAKKDTYIHMYLNDSGIDNRILHDKITRHDTLYSRGGLRLHIAMNARFKIDYKKLCNTVNINKPTVQAINNSDVILMIHPCDIWKFFTGLINAIESDIIIPVFGDIDDYQRAADRTFNKNVKFISTSSSDSIQHIKREMLKGSKLLIFADLPSRKMNILFGETKETTFFKKKAYFQYGPFILAYKSKSRITSIFAIESHNTMTIEHRDIEKNSPLEIMSSFIEFYESSINKHPESIAYLRRLPTYHYQPITPLDKFKNLFQ